MLGILKQKHRAVPIIAALILTILAWMLPANVSAAETPAVASICEIDFNGAAQSDLSGRKLDGVDFAWTTNLTGTLDKFVTDYSKENAKEWTVARDGNKLKFTAKNPGKIGVSGPAAKPATDEVITITTAAKAAKYELDLTGANETSLPTTGSVVTIDKTNLTWDTSPSKTAENFTKAHTNKAYGATANGNKLILTAKVAGALAAGNTDNASPDAVPSTAPVIQNGGSDSITIPGEAGANAVYKIDLSGANKLDLTGKTIDDVPITWDTDLDTLDATMGKAENSTANPPVEASGFCKTYNEANPAKDYTASYDETSDILTLTAKQQKAIDTAPATTIEKKGQVLAVYTYDMAGKDAEALKGKKIDDIEVLASDSADTDLDTIMNQFVTAYTNDNSKQYVATYNAENDTLTLTGKTTTAAAPAASDITGLGSVAASPAANTGTDVSVNRTTEGKAPGNTTQVKFTCTQEGTAEGTKTLTATETTIGAEAMKDTPTQPTTPSTPGGSGSGGTTPSTPTTPTTPTTPDAPTIEVKPDGTKVETITQTQPDGTKVETVTETKPDGTKTETKTETKVDGSTVENKVVTEPNGTTVKTEVITNADGTVQRESEATIQADGSATEVVKETQTNSAGKQVASTTTTKTDAAGKLLSETKTAVIANPAKDTTATVNVKTNAAGTTTAAAAVTKPGNDRKSGTNGIVYASIVKQITEAAGTNDVTIRQKVTDPDGKTAFTVQVNARDLTAGKNLRIVRLDKKGNPVLVNAKTYPVTKAGNVSVTMDQGGTYQLLNASEAKKVSNAILKTVQAKKTAASVKKGKKTSMALSSKLNKSNVAKITYSTSNKSVVKVSKSGTIAAKKKGTALVKAKVTLKNGKTKTVQMKVKVK